MLNVSEITGGWTIPYCIDLANDIWSIVNETGLFAIPFVIVLGATFLQARSMGEDEGSPAVMFIKLLEKKWIAMFVCMYLFTLPTSIGSGVPSSYNNSSFSEINFKEYSCRGDNASILGDSASTSNITPNLAESLSLDVDVPVMFGLANQLFQGITQSLNAKIPCDDDYNPFLLQGKGSTFSAHGDEKLTYSIKHFVNQCYLKARGFISKSIVYGNYNEGVPLSDKQEYFNSAQLYAGYSGGLTVGKTTSSSSSSSSSSTTKVITSPTLYMTFNGDKWVGSSTDGDEIVSSGDSDEDRSLNCLQASRTIYSTVTDSSGPLYTYYSDLITTGKTTLEAYTDQDGENLSDSDVINKFAHQFVMDVSSGIQGMLNVNHSDMDQFAKKDNQTVGDIVTRGASIFQEVGNDISTYVLSLTAPIIVSALIGILFISIPIILPLSGYSLKVGTTLIYVLAFLIGTSYVLDIGWYIENVLLGLAASEFGFYSVDNSVPNGTLASGGLGTNVATLIPLLQSTVVPTVLGIWTMLAGLLGVYVIPVFSQVMTRLSSDVGKNGSAALQMVVKAAIKHSK